MLRLLPLLSLALFAYAWTEWNPPALMYQTAGLFAL